MKKLAVLLRDPNLRFKTIAELINEYGNDWCSQVQLEGPGNFDGMYYGDAINTLGMYAGKKFYGILVMGTAMFRDTYHYGPTHCLVHKNMLTTRMMPKYDNQGDVLKPGMLVIVDWVYKYEPAHRIPNDLRNEAGTITRILKVNNPLDYCTVKFKDNDALNKLVVATELLTPRSGSTWAKIESIYGEWFKRDFEYHLIVAFEVSYHLRKATEKERQAYYKLMR